MLHTKPKTVSYFNNDSTKLSMLSLSKLDVGSSKASTAHFVQNISAKTSRITKEART